MDGRRRCGTPRRRVHSPRQRRAATGSPLGTRRNEATCEWLSGEPGEDGRGEAAPPRANRQRPPLFALTLVVQGARARLRRHGRDDVASPLGYQTGGEGPAMVTSVTTTRVGSRWTRTVSLRDGPNPIFPLGRVPVKVRAIAEERMAHQRSSQQVHQKSSSWM
jgi:hypothetical protein